MSSELIFFLRRRKAFLRLHKALQKARKIEIDLVARLVDRKEPRFIKLGERLEELRERHEQGLLTSIEFLKHLLQLAPLTRM